MLRSSPAPAPALRSVLAALGSPTAVHEARTPALRAAPGPLSPELPLPVHLLRLSAAPGQPRTRLVGWRFLIRCGDRAVAAAETVPDPDGGWAFSHFFEGPYVTATERALAQAEALPGAYQPRLLSVPELYMLTLWLRPEPGADGAEPDADAADVLVPLAPAPPGIAAHRPYRAADLLPVLSTRLAPPPFFDAEAPAA
ncbi:hypothetical protein ACIQRS_30625 [Streptomyces termitum]|uniref:Uncharacterized protein n=1 Tax=Streptomyces termitum TaxID=67368 RepID=A0A918W9A9_9ACTN|nr:hypothetical protein [Streptomyces termitum]GHA84267.1 hypothetical protein GCM10010305_29970 [Streptomyces termitum]